MNGVVYELIRLNEDLQDGEFEEKLGFKGKPKLGRLFNQFKESPNELDALDVKNDKNFMMQRLKVINRLVDLLMFIPLESIRNSKYFVDFFTMLRNLYLSRLLLAIGMYQSGVWLLRSTIRKAQKLESWESILTGSNILINYFAVRGDSINLNIYSKLSKNAIEMVSKEIELKKMFNKWMLIFSKKRNATSFQIDQLKNDVRRAKNILKGSSHINILHMVKRLELIYLDAKMDYEGIIVVSKTTSNYILNNSGYSDYNKLGVYTGIQMYACLNLKRTIEAKTLYKKMESFNSPGTLNWFIFMEYYFVLLIQSGEYDKAYNVYGRIVNNQGFKLLKGVQGNIWTLLTAYMQFLAITSIWEESPKELAEMNFKTSRFINDVFKLGGDKTGLNVSILILQILFLLHYERYPEIIDKKDALKRYVYRYLYSKENDRSRIFMTMLLRMIENEFSYSKTVEKTKRLSGQLKSIEMNYRANLGGNEIVDYELLWSWVLDTLKKRWSIAA